MSVVNTSAHFRPDRQIAVLQTACQQARLGTCRLIPSRVGINLSPSQLQSGDLAGTVAEVVAATGVTPSLIELEVPPRTSCWGRAARARYLPAHPEAGCPPGVFDDFGTGFASLSYRKKLPLDGLKIDSLLRSRCAHAILTTPRIEALSSIIRLGKQLRLSVIAEGIETRATADPAGHHAAFKEGQGYFFGKPMPAADLDRTWLNYKAA